MFERNTFIRNILEDSQSQVSMRDWIALAPPSEAPNRRGCAARSVEVSRLSASLATTSPSGAPTRGPRSRRCQARWPESRPRGRWSRHAASRFACRPRSRRARRRSHPARPRRRSRVNLHVEHPVEDQEHVRARLVLLHESVSPWPGVPRQHFGVGHDDPGELALELDSTAVTSAGESSPPHGVFGPNDSRHQRSKSISPLLSTRAPLSS